MLGVQELPSVGRQASCRLLCSYVLMFLCVSETRLLPNISNQFIDLPQYSVFRCAKGRGGGVCIFVRNNLSATLLPTHTINRPTGVEDVWITMRTEQHENSSNLVKHN